MARAWSRSTPRRRPSHPTPTRYCAARPPKYYLSGGRFASLADEKQQPQAVPIASCGPSSTGKTLPRRQERLPNLQRTTQQDPCRGIQLGSKAREARCALRRCWDQHKHSPIPGNSSQHPPTIVGSHRCNCRFRFGLRRHCQGSTLPSPQEVHSHHTHLRANSLRTLWSRG